MGTQIALFSGAKYSPDGRRWRLIQRYPEAGLVLGAVTALCAWSIAAKPLIAVAPPAAYWVLGLITGWLALHSLGYSRELIFDRHAGLWTLIEQRWFFVVKRREGPLKPPLKLRWQLRTFISNMPRDRSYNEEHLLWLVLPDEEVLAGQMGPGLDSASVRKLADWLGLELKVA